MLAILWTQCININSLAKPVIGCCILLTFLCCIEMSHAQGGPKNGLF